MAFWNFYFFSTAALHLMGYLHASFLPEALLFAGVLAPIPQRWPRARWLQGGRTALAALAAFVILWNATYLPSLKDAWAYLSDPMTVKPAPSYLWRFVLGGLSPVLLAVLAALLAAVVIAARMGLRLTVLSALALGAIAVTGPSSRDGSDIDAFYRSEEGRTVLLEKAGKGPPGFDVIVLQVCSFSWDDFKAAGVDAGAFFAKFDFLFTRFNSATSHSNPAAIRLLRAPCGQLPHAGLYQPAADPCYLMDSLRRRGFATASAMNFHPQDGDFGPDIIKNSKADPALGLEGLRPRKLNFDDSPVYGDLDVLSRWWKRRQASGAPAAALYYNTTSLHQGSHWPVSVQKDPWSQTPAARYGTFAKLLFSELEQFFAALEASGRKVVVIVVGEHGAALAGSRIQAPDLREIPLSSITVVPAAVRIFGRRRKDAQVVIGKPTSYLALAQLLGALLESAPFENRAPSAADLAAALPETRFVAETSGARVMQAGAGFIYQAKQGRWIELPK